MWLKRKVFVQTQKKHTITRPIAVIWSCTLRTTISPARSVTTRRRISNNTKLIAAFSILFPLRILIDITPNFEFHDSVMSEALERDAAAAGLAAGKGAGPKFPRNGPAGSVQSVEEARFVKFVENTARLATQSMSRVRWCESALFEFIVVQRDWFVVKIAADMNKKYDGKLASAVNGAARKAIHKTTRHCYIWSECVQQYWKKLRKQARLLRHLPWPIMLLRSSRQPSWQVSIASASECWMYGTRQK